MRQRGGGTASAATDSRVTSASFSWSAEQGNVEFGLLVDNGGLTESVEREMRRSEDSLYEQVLCGTRTRST